MEGVGYMKTVRQLSEQLGIAKQSVDYHVKKLNESYIKEGNVNMIDDRLEQLIIERVNNNKQQTTDNVEDKEDDSTSIDYETIVEQYEARIRDLKESHANHIKDLNKQLDEKQQAIEYLTVSVATNRLNSEENSSEDTRSIVSSGSNQSDNKDDTQHTYEDAHTRSTDESTNEPIDVSDQTNTNIEDTESNKRKGFFARLFNL